jgi:ketol-acid reductoisomerase
VPEVPGTEVREEYKRGFGVPTLIAVHTENDPNGDGLEIAKALAVGTGGDRAGVLESSPIAEVKSDLMGEQTILCGMLQTGAILCFDKMVEKGIDPGYASKLIQYGWETITEALKHGGITNMMDRLGNPAKLRAFYLAEELKTIMRPLYEKHQDDIMSGEFSRTMMEDWANGDATSSSGAPPRRTRPSRRHREHGRGDPGAGVLRPRHPAGRHVQGRRGAGLRGHGIRGHQGGIRLLRVTPRDTADRQHDRAQEALRDERGDLRHRRVRLLPLRPRLPPAAGGLHGRHRDGRHRRGLGGDTTVDNQELIRVNEAIRSHPVEVIGKTLRGYMTAMKSIL